MKMEAQKQRGCRFNGSSIVRWRLLFSSFLFLNCKVYDIKTVFCKKAHFNKAPKMVF